MECLNGTTDTAGKLEYYKSLVTDDEVINALVKDSRARDGDIEKTRVRPNMNFFHRTVTNLLSTNTRIIKRQEELVAREKDKYKCFRRKEEPFRRKTHRQLINEILSERIEFVKSTSEIETENIGSSSRRIMKEDQTARVKVKYKSVPRKEEPVKRKTHRQLINEILSERIEFVKPTSSDTSKNEKDLSEMEIEHVISTSPRVTKGEEELIPTERSKNKCFRRKKEPFRKKTNKQLINEILSGKTGSVKPSSDDSSKSETDLSETETEHVRTASQRSVESITCLTIDSDSTDSVEIVSINTKDDKSHRKARNKKKKKKDLPRDPELLKIKKLHTSSKNENMKISKHTCVDLVTDSD